MNAYEILADLPYFSALPEEELENLCRAAEIMDVAAGTVVIEEGEEPGALLVVADGAFEAVRRSAEAEIVIGVAGTGEVLGEMSLLEGRPASATLRALSPGRVVRLPASDFKRVVEHPALLLGMFLTVTRRLREREGALVQAEKLAALGTMTAGLLHEVNNPAAAIKRSAAGLVEVAEHLIAPAIPVQLSALRRAELEEEMAAYLKTIGLTEAADLAGSLVAAGWDVNRLQNEGGNERAETLRIARLVHARQLAEEVAMAASRLSELVSAVKSWVYLDQAPLQDINLNLSVQQTMAMLRHKLSGIRLDLELDPTLPTIEARGAELNQVITNVVDNAIQAATSVVTIRTMIDGNDVVCEIVDDGPGIPEKVLDRIWEPFFTTKPPGQGTGLGLPISRRIIESQRGRLTVHSVPGSTRFVLRMPIAAT